MQSNSFIYFAACSSADFSFVYDQKAEYLFGGSYERQVALSAVCTSLIWGGREFIFVFFASVYVKQ